MAPASESETERVADVRSISKPDGGDDGPLMMFTSISSELPDNKRVFVVKYSFTSSEARTVTKDPATVLTDSSIVFAWAEVRLP